MKFGKLQNIEKVDFSLPPDPEENVRLLKRYNLKTGQLQFYMGCTGWSMKEWVGKVYPSNAKTKDFLRAYGRQFNSIELNTTHYRIPTEETILKWRNETPADFKFCPKIPQSISHSRNLGVGSDSLIQFCENIQELKEKLGCCFMQLPPYFDYKRLALLEKFLQHFPNHIPLAVELRHESWFNHPDHQSALFELLEKYHVSPVITDVAGRRDVLHMRLTTPTAMVRFVGNGLHPTDFSRIDAWIERIRNWQQEGLVTIYFFPHEPDNIQAPELAAYILKKLSDFPDIKVRGPKLEDPDNQEGQQMSLF